MTQRGTLGAEQVRAQGSRRPGQTPGGTSHRGSMRVLPPLHPDELWPGADEAEPAPRVATPVALPLALPAYPHGAEGASADLRHGISARPAAPGPRRMLPRAHLHAAEALETARHEIASQAWRIAELDGLLRRALEDLGKKTTDVRNLTGRLRDLQPFVEGARAGAVRLEEARTELRRVQAERDAERMRRIAAEDALAALRGEIDWRDFVIRDLEPMPDRLREAERLVAKLQDEVADCRSQIASRDDDTAETPRA